MAVIRLTLDIDSAVHPELHAMLSEVGSDAAREERMRALAASGLAWERFRMLSQAPATAQPATAAAWVAPAVAGAPTPTRETDEAAPVATTTATVSAQDKLAAAAEERLRDFVDLAINAEPEPVPQSVVAMATSMEAPRPVPPDDFEANVESIARELPVLLDVVEVEAPPWVRPVLATVEAQHGSGHGIEPEPAMSAIPPAPLPSVVALRPAQATSTANDDDLITVTVVPRKAPSRERVMRMKERGLFKNG